MPISTSLKIAGVAGLAAIATGVGVGQAIAADSTTSPSSSASSGTSGSTSGPSTESGPPGDGRRFRGGTHRMDAAALATKLGLDESKVSDAIEAVREARHDSPDRDIKDRTPPTEAERTAKETEFAAALAEELGIDQAKVIEALAAIRAEHQAAAKAALGEKLDAAVDAGKLTAADKASVLKAFDAGVLGGGLAGHGGPGGHGRP